MIIHSFSITNATMVCHNNNNGLCLDLSGPMPSAYSPKYVEAVWYDWWEKQVCYNDIITLDLICELSLYRDSLNRSMG